ncbi:MAG TPA: SDR family oxidoreductase [Bryobacteraceae bacterium]|nr:SDR family oxidoreductase [Bryobacteraceae bacterium]
MPRFSDRIALVTGASSGIGNATAERMAAEGARIIAVGRNEERLRSAAAAWQRPGEHVVIPADVSTENGVNALFAAIRSQGLHADIAVFAAGRHLIRPLAMTKTQQLEEMMRGNLFSTLLCTREFARLPGGEARAVVWVSSAAALIGNTGEIAYAAAKGALISACRAAAAEYAAKFRVNCVAPGVVETPMSAAWIGRLTPEQRAAVESRHLLGFGRPEDVAAAIAFLASRESRWITGVCLPVDGGLIAH